jgi:integrase
MIIGVADGARTHDNRNHNPGLYQLSYSHHENAL